VHHGFAIALVPKLAWPTNARGLSRIALRVEWRTVTRELALARRTGRLSPLVEEFRRHLAAPQPR
jgi:DNA-binding transcriptional LysR family regulator